MANVIRKFRIAGSARVFSLQGAAIPEVEPLLRRRDIPWNVGGISVRHWLTRAEILSIDKNFAQSPGALFDDGYALCQLIKGKKAASGGSLLEYDRNFRKECKGYVDLPKKFDSKNPYFAFTNGPFPWVTMGAGNNITSNKILNKWINTINSEYLFAPDDMCALSDLHNDKKNFRGIFYLSFLVERPEPLRVLGSSISFTIDSYLIAKRTTRKNIKNMFHAHDKILYQELSYLANDVLCFNGVPLY